MGIAASLLLAAIRGAELNVRVNTDLMKEESKKKEREEEVEVAMRACHFLEEAVEVVEEVILGRVERKRNC